MERFLTDENIPPPVIQSLKNKGFDVRAIREFVPPGGPPRRMSSALPDKKKGFSVPSINTLRTSSFTRCELMPVSSESVFILHPPLMEDILVALENFLGNIDLKEVKGSLVILERDGFRIRRKT